MVPTKLYACCCLLIFLFSPVSEVTSQDSEDDQSPKPFIEAQPESSPRIAPTENPFSALISWVLALILVIAVIYILAFFVKKGLIRTQQPLGPQGSFRIIGHLTLSPKLMLYLVEVADRILVMAITDDSATTLSEITEPDMVNKLRNEASIYEPQTPNFVEYFRQAADRLKRIERA